MSNCSLFQLSPTPADQGSCNPLSSMWGHVGSPEVVAVPLTSTVFEPTVLHISGSRFLPLSLL